MYDPDEAWRRREEEITRRIGERRRHLQEGVRVDEASREEIVKRALAKSVCPAAILAEIKERQDYERWLDEALAPRRASLSSEGSPWLYPYLWGTHNR